MMPVLRDHAIAALCEAFDDEIEMAPWTDALAAVDALSALLPWQLAGGFRDRASAALRALPSWLQHKENIVDECPDCFGDDPVCDRCEGIGTVTRTITHDPPRVTIDADSARSALLAIFEEVTTP